MSAELGPRMRPRGFRTLGPHVTLLGFGTFVFVRSLNYGWIDPGGVTQPGLFPGVAAVGIMLFAVIEIVGAAARREAAPPVPDRASVLVTRERKRRVAVVLITMLGTVLVMPVVGLTVAVGLAIFTILLVLEGKSLKYSACVAIVAPAGLWFLFEILLSVPLPRSMIGW